MGKPTLENFRKRNQLWLLSPIVFSICIKANETQDHIFIRFQGLHFLGYTLKAFGWTAPLHRTIVTNLSSTLTEHILSKGTLKLVWLNLITSFLWTTWIERNNIIFTLERKHPLLHT